MNEDEYSDAAGAVDRVIHELRRGREIELHDERSAWCLVPVEALTDARWQGLAKGANELFLCLTRNRLLALGIEINASGGRIRVDSNQTLANLQCLSGAVVEPTGSRCEVTAELLGTTHPLTATVLELALQARLLPAMLVWESGRAAQPAMPGLAAASVADYVRLRASALRLISRARVPLAGHEACEFILFRESYGDNEHVAIVIGEPDLNAPVPVRLHSSCLTGDLLGSLRCDCGDQLRTAVERIATAGGGVLLYLAQEGRGIGLANKLRAYGLQDAGLDTLQADRHLGFSAEERDFRVACTLLQALNIRRIRLLTNNPEKIRVLEEGGIEVVDRLPLLAPTNPHNERYVRTKHEDAGHLREG
ncbi:MAG: GTP cyclohydrolase II [Thiotrichales bacterium]